MPTKIYSFGFRHWGGSPNLAPDALVIDVRRWFTKNPYHDKALRKLRGTDDAVQAELRKTPAFQETIDGLCDRVRDHMGPVYLGCTGGHHRSVYAAILLGHALNVPVEHLDIEKP